MLWVPVKGAEGRIYEPTTAQMLMAAAQTWNDKLADKTCVILCQEYDWICASNDKAVRAQCAQHSIERMWGPNVMLRLIELGQLSAHDSIRVMKSIRSNNPFIKQKTVDDFTKKVNKAESEQRED